MADSERPRLEDPVVVCVSGSNHEAQITVAKLQASGIPAVTVEDMSPAGMISIGTLPEIHRPQVFVSRAVLEDAIAIIADDSQTVGGDDETPSYCYHCGSPNSDDKTTCLDCGAVIDADETPSDRQNSGTTLNDSLRSSKRIFALIFLAPVIAVPLFLLWLFLSILF
ncbi:MAG: hypothetical protein ABJZ55_04380 [Fuerstiella sp.]